MSTYTITMPPPQQSCPMMFGVSMIFSFTSPQRDSPADTCLFWHLPVLECSNGNTAILVTHGLPVLSFSWPSWTATCLLEAYCRQLHNDNEIWMYKGTSPCRLLQGAGFMVTSLLVMEFTSSCMQTLGFRAAVRDGEWVGELFSFTSFICAPGTS